MSPTASLLDFGFKAASTACFARVILEYAISDWTSSAVGSGAARAFEPDTARNDLVRDTEGTEVDFGRLSDVVRRKRRLRIYWSH